MPTQGISAGSDLLTDLNPAQREAALKLVGPVAILAGPGTGKTHTITRRIAYGVRCGVYTPERVLALTFTNRAAGQLRGRLANLGATAVQARTFHAAALRQLSYFWPNTVGGQFPGVIASKSDLIAEAAQRAGARVNPGQLRSIAEQIEWRKVSELTLDEYTELLASGQRENETGLDADTLARTVAAYETVKDTRGKLDFEDILLATAGMLESEPWVTAQVRGQYRFFVVDEYQDISPLQHKLLRLWLGNRRELCVVGDPAQTIYSFAGAQANYLTAFTSDFPEAQVIRVDESYRSAAPVIAAANELAKHIPNAITLSPKRSETGLLPVLLDYPDEQEQAVGIAGRIRTEIDRGTPASAIAILVRTNAQIPQLEQALSEAGIGYRLAGGIPFFSRPEVRAVVAGIHAAQLAGQDSGPLFQQVSRVLQSRGWRQHPPTTAGPQRDAWVAMNAIMRLADTAPTGTSLTEFSAMLRERAAHQHEPELEAVTLSTMHAAKGLEWDSVYIAGMREGLLPVTSALDDEEALAEERRVFYVAITRARNRLTLAAMSPRSRYLAELSNRVFVEQLD